MRLAELLDWLDGNYRDPISVDQMARRAGMSRKTLERAFRDCFQVSPMQYVNSLRVIRAERLLRETNSKVSEIAAQVGVDGANYFARVFRKHTGLEPTRYRAQRRQLVAS